MYETLKSIAAFFAICGFIVGVPFAILVLMALLNPFTPL